MTEQNFVKKAHLAKSTPMARIQVMIGARKHHRQRLTLVILTVFPELSAGHVVANRDW